MPLIRVYRYRVFSDEHGAFIDTEFAVYAPLEKITSIEAQLIMENSIEIEESQLSQEGFYHDQS